MMTATVTFGFLLVGCLTTSPPDDDDTHPAGDADSDVDTGSDVDTDSPSEETRPDPDPAAPFVLLELFTSQG